MLQINVPAGEFFDEERGEFVNTKATTLTLEHSLVSLSKWESKWCKPFLSKQDRSIEEIMDYIKCMTLTQNVDPNVYLAISYDNLEKIKRYINDPHTATTITERPGAPKSHEIITSELIYYWMISLSIPFECQKWHLNRLLMLIKVCNIKNGPQQKMGTRQLLSRNAALNATRRKQLHSKG